MMKTTDFWPHRHVLWYIDYKRVRSHLATIVPGIQTPNKFLVHFSPALVLTYGVASYN